MRLPARVSEGLAARVIAAMQARTPDFIIGDKEDPYLARWHLIPRNPVFNLYAHRFLRSDDDRALHDHPWLNASVLLDNTLTEHTIAAGGVHHRRILRELAA